MDRATFLALLARLRGEGDNVEPLSVEELAALQAYIDAHRGDVEALTDAELGEVDERLRALADDEDVTTETLLAAADVVEVIGTVDAEREQAAQAAEQERQAAIERLRPVASDTGDGEGGEGGAGDGAAGEGGEGDGAAGEGEGGDAGAGDGAGTGDGDGTADGGEGDGAAGEGAGDGAGAQEPVAATAAGRATTPTRTRRVGGERRPNAPTRRARIVRDGGGEFADIYEAGEAMVARRESMLSFGSSGVGADKITVASVRADYPESRQLDARNPVLTAERLAVVAAMDGMNGEQLAAVTAAGGPCAPLENQYDIPTLGESERPMRASFTQFQATRAGIQYRNPLDIPDFASAVEFWTIDNDTTPGSDGPATKPCMELECPGLLTARIYAVTECLKIGNFMARFDPETVRASQDMLAVAFARKAETKLIDLTKAASTQVTAGQALGAFRDLAYYVGVLAAAFRSRHRLRRDAIVETRFPAWIYDMAREDIARSLPAYADQLAVADDVLNRMFALRNVRVAALYIDSPTTGTSQVFGAQGVGDMLDFPDQVQWHMTHPGAFSLLDNGRLDLGVIRDQDLVETNDYKTFAETFEGLAYRGLESDWVTQDICANGAASGTVDPGDFCAGDYVPQP